MENSFWRCGRDTRYVHFVPVSLNRCTQKSQCLFAVSTFMKNMKCSIRDRNKWFVHSGYLKTYRHIASIYYIVLLRTYHGFLGMPEFPPPNSKQTNQHTRHRHRVDDKSAFEYINTDEFTLLYSCMQYCNTCSTHYQCL